MFDYFWKKTLSEKNLYNRVPTLQKFDLGLGG